MKTKKRISLLLGLIMAVLTVLGGMTNITLVEANAAATVSSAKCVLTDAANVQFSAKLTAAPATDDGLLYLYQLKTYEYAIPAGAQPIANCASSANAVMNFALGGVEANGRLYAKYALAAKQGGKVVMLGNPQYISNPEVLATHTHRDARPAKTTQHDELTNLVINGSGEGSMPVAFTKHTVQVLCNGGTVVTNPKAALGDTHPLTPQNYMFNAANDAGIAGLVKDMTNYAANSKGQDFIIGNEVNERMWSYMAFTSWEDFIKEYVQAFRVCYTAIKSNNADAKVYISLDQNWNRNRPKGHAEYYSYMDGNDFLNAFENNILAGGNIDWDLAIHPYTVPLTYAKFWDMSGAPDGAYCAKMVNSNAMMSFQNMSVVTSYMTKANMLNRAGKVRDIIINEIGINATQGEDVQAAALCAAYYAFEKNPYVTQFMYLGNAGYGVNATLTPKAQAAFNSFGGADEANQMNWAKSVIGISDWSQIIR